ncbi:helix-turn-helix domain-containing protein [Paenibacillus albus]|uniref:Uncharacterized protein n=1 Tax=Paenibacillus albus TaxID=2495582 RepID=A0A3Q8X773_9BACL|nr:helix-turn-helix domain-containing protein [Paenibacillus albus]AZN40449.1 hypothetical protein EJC50_12885 [Paenibacillus albus]
MSEQPKRRGRPPKLYKNELNVDVQAKMCKLLREGHYIEPAAALCGVDRNTVYKWLKAGARGEDELYMAFHAAVERATAEAEQNALGVIRHAGKTQWQAAAWYLERRHPFKWGKRTQVDANVTSTEVQWQVEEEQVAAIEQRLMDDPECAELLEQLYIRSHAKPVFDKSHLEIPTL